MDRVKVIWVPYVPRARPSVPPPGPQTGILGFSQKGTEAKRGGEAILRSCEPEPQAASREPLFASHAKFPPKQKIKKRGMMP